MFTHTGNPFFPTITFLLMAAAGFGQKVDLDRFHFDVNYIKLPREYVQPDDRTVGVRVGLGGNIRRASSEQAIYDNINVAGFQKVENNPAVGVTFTMNDLRIEKTEMKTRMGDGKDKNGKTAKVELFTLIATYSTTGRFQLYGPKTGEPRQAKKNPPTQPNRFLKAIAGDQATNPSAYQTKITEQNFPDKITYSTREYQSSAEATQYFERNQRSIQFELITNYINDALRIINEQANTWYGYVPVKSQEFLWILDSKKHPEYPIQQEAIKAVKTLMPTMTATESPEQLAQNLRPVMDYFEDLKTKYPGNDKTDIKMRYSAYYNLATLHYFLDQPDETAKEAEELIKNGYDTGDGKKYLRLANELRQSLEKHRMDSRHMIR